MWPGPFDAFGVIMRVRGEQLGLVQDFTQCIESESHRARSHGGSLTTPACTENVTWVVLKKQSRLTHEQWNSFRRILGNNFRPLQNLNDRTIWATADKGGKHKHKERHDHDD